MSDENRIERRSFLKDLAGGAAAAATWQGAPAILARPKPNEIIGVANIGVGTQGHRLLQSAQAVDKTEIRVVSDLYDGNIARAKRLCTNPKLRIVKDWEKAISDPDVDAVIIAVPDFMHAPITIAAAESKKDIYVEKAWCTKVADAKKMREAVKGNQVVMQLGHHFDSLPYFHKAREIFRSGQLGPVPLVRSYIDRTDSFPEWRFYTDYDITKVPSDASEQTIDWQRFQAQAPSKRPFDALRFFNWRCYWDYGTGIAGDLLSHIWDSINFVIDMGIPESAVTQGGLYYWKDGREVPDMWHVLFDYPKQNLAVTFACSFHNKHVDEVTQILGRDQTLEVSSGFCRAFTGEWKPEYEQKMEKARDLAGDVWKIAKEKKVTPPLTVAPPDYVYHEGDLRVSSHMENFLECVRTRELPRCHVDRAFQEAVAVVMSLEAFRQERKVRWDPVKEEIV